MLRYSRRVGKEQRIGGGNEWRSYRRLVQPVLARFKLGLFRVLYVDRYGATGFEPIAEARIEIGERKEHRKKHE